MKYLPIVSGLIVGLLTGVFCNLTNLSKQQIGDVGLATILIVDGGLAAAAAGKVQKEQERRSKVRTIKQTDLEAAIAEIERTAVLHGNDGIQVATALRELQHRLDL